MRASSVCKISFICVGDKLTGVSRPRLKSTTFSCWQVKQIFFSVLPQHFLGESMGSGAITGQSGRRDTEKSQRGQSLMKEQNTEKYMM